MSSTTVASMSFLRMPQILIPMKMRKMNTSKNLLEEINSLKQFKKTRLLNIRKTIKIKVVNF